MASLNTTKQIDHWSGEEGNAYVDRNPHSMSEMEALYAKDYGVSRAAMNQEFLHGLDKSISILEVGANVATQLEFLRQQGFTRLLGVDVNRQAVTAAKQLHPNVDVIEASGFDLPFKDGAFELVYTSGVLIHIAPSDIAKIIAEMHRTTSKYIWGFEYYAPEYTDIEYRGKKDLLWKTDFASLILAQCPDMRLVQEHKYPMTDGVNITQMYLLEKIAR